MIPWIELHSTTLLASLGLIGLLTFVGSLIALPILAARLPADYFTVRAKVVPPWRGPHPIRGTLLWVARNLLGLVLVLGGIWMLFLPGQGLLTLAIGLHNIPEGLATATVLASKNVGKREISPHTNQLQYPLSDIHKNYIHVRVHLQILSNNILTSS